MNDDYLLDNCQIYSNFFTIEGQIIIIPELWKAIEWNDIFFEKHIKDYVTDPLDSSGYASENLQLVSIDFFRELKKINYYALFTALPRKEILKLPYDSYVENSFLYQNIIENIIFVGWYSISYTESAFMDGYYPFQIETNNKVKTILYDENKYMLNKFFLIKSLEYCEKICLINNDFNGNQEIWFPIKIFVDKYTFEKINI